MATIVLTVVRDGIPPARTPFKIQDPYTGRFIWNKDDNLHLQANGDGEGNLWELEYSAQTATAAAAVPAGDAEHVVQTGYLLRNVLTGKVVVDESAGDGGHLGFGVKDVNESGELETQVWTMRPLDCDGRRGRLFCIQNRRSRAYIVNGLQARGKKQLRTRGMNEESKSQAWRFILMSEPAAEIGFESPSTSNRITATPCRIPRMKRSRSGDFMDNFRHLGGTDQQAKCDLHDRDIYWKRMPPIPDQEDFCEHALGELSQETYLPGRLLSNSNLSTAGDTNNLQEGSSDSWMSRPSWKKWISAVSDFDVSWMAPKIGTTRALQERDSYSVDGNELIDSSWYCQPKLRDSP